MFSSFAAQVLTQCLLTVVFSVSISTLIFLLKTIGIVCLTPELNLQCAINAKPVRSIQDMKTKRTVTSLREREGSERILVRL